MSKKKGKKTRFLTAAELESTMKDVERELGLETKARDEELAAIIRTIELLGGDAVDGSVEAQDAQISSMVLAKMALRRLNDAPVLFPKI
jgi:hypothetical protein